MKIQTVNGIVNILGGPIKIMAVKDKKLRDTILNDYLHLREFAREANKKRQDIVDKFNADYNGADTNSEDYKKALSVLNDTIGAMLNEEVETSLKPVPLGDFMGVPGAETLTLEQVAFLIEYGVLKDG